VARQPRLALPGQAHALLQVGIGSKPVFVDEQDRRYFLTVLFETAALEHTRVHAWALLDHEVRLVVTPEAAPQLARLVQGVGRRYVAAYNRRHASSGTLWSGRFRSALLEPGAVVLDALLWVDGASALPGHTSAGLRTGALAHTARPASQTQVGGASGLGLEPQARARSTLAKANSTALADPAEHWSLGNTPFEREAAYRALLQNGLPASRQRWLHDAIWGGWVAGGTAFASDTALGSTRRARPLTAGRPRKAVG
jgi:putative transposase